MADYTEPPAGMKPVVDNPSWTGYLRRGNWVNVVPDGKSLLDGEKFIIETLGGPTAGRFGVLDGVSTYDTPDGLLTVSWPLPGILSGPEGSLGVYEKVSESELKERPANEHIVRSASYEWRPKS